MEAITLPIYNTLGKEVETIKLDPAVFDGAVNTAAVHQAINAYLAAQRKGLATVKSRGEVSGGGRKPWKQKGTGRARVGSTRSPLWRHGGVTFGPQPRDFAYTLPAKLRDLALKSSLCAKVAESNLVILDSIVLEQVKTKEAAKIMSNLKIGTKAEKKGNVLLLISKTDSNIKRAFKNIGSLRLDVAKDANAYEVLVSKKLVLTKEALQDLIKRLKK